ncbi:MAG: hypothetical protein M1821_004598 [Bathelium mastoideum]|nr:MAG: hypothetical protein M1821_004598 [Bathelium mastoideum]
MTTQVATTEIALLPLSPDASTSSLAHARTTVASQPGFLRLHHGTRLEDSSQLSWLINWTSLGAHETFMSSPAYGPFIDGIMPQLSKAAVIRHYAFTGGVKQGGADPLEAPVTELATFYLPKGFDQAKVDAAFETLQGEINESRAEGYRGSRWGYSVEEVEHESLGEEKGRACVLLVGWDSKEAHEAFRQTEAFTRGIGPVREVTQGREVFHSRLELHR